MALLVSLSVSLQLVFNNMLFHLNGMSGFLSQTRFTWENMISRHIDERQGDQIIKKRGDEVLLSVQGGSIWTTMAQTSWKQGHIESISSFSFTFKSPSAQLGLNLKSYRGISIKLYLFFIK